jgi:hypothetical protein
MRWLRSHDTLAQETGEVSGVGTSHQTIVTGRVWMHFLAEKYRYAGRLSKEMGRNPHEKQTPWTYGADKIKYVPFRGPRIWKLELTNGVVGRVRVKGPIMKIIGVFKI